MTKFALEAYSDALQAEVETLGIHVASIQPGGVNTDIGEKSLEDTLRRLRSTPPPLDVYADPILASLEHQASSQPYDPDLPESTTNRKMSDPIIVSEAIYHAITSQLPKHRYLVGTHWEGNRVLYALLRKFLDENDNPEHQYTREQIIQILDQLLEERSLRS
jgi:NAD(P)-dependent dehydrogenase (short-subunit alcohol dehydrogenase family)